MIAAGHPLEAVWRYTPRQMHAFLYFADKRQKQQWRETVTAQVLGSRGDSKVIDRALKE